MVLRSDIDIIKRTFMFISLVLFFSCEKNGEGIIDCLECSSEEPVLTGLQIKLNELHTEKVIEIFEGNLEDSILYDSFTTSASDEIREVLLNKKYTLTAKYNIRGNIYIVINSVTPRAQFDEDFCEKPCYYVYDKTVNLRLKYTK